MQTATVTAPTLARNDATATAEAAWRAARIEGAEPALAAHHAWEAVRRARPNLRAPSGLEAVDSNKPNGRRSYRCPLAEEVLATGRADFRDFGSHAGEYRRTMKSVVECRERREALLQLLVEAWG